MVKIHDNVPAFQSGDRVFAHVYDKYGKVVNSQSVVATGFIYHVVFDDGEVTNTVRETWLEPAKNEQERHNEFDCSYFVVMFQKN